jgi:threonine/homoserine/homoserine lactone efflux protein
MPDPSTLVLVAFACLLLAIVPGPAVLYIVTRSMSQGRSAGLVSVAGIHVGTLVHVMAATLGLSAVLVRSGVAFNVVKYAGAAYLVYLGIRRLSERGQLNEGLRLEAQRPGRIFTQGIVVNVLNPKTALFFFAFLPQFVEPGHGTLPLQMLILGLVFMTVACVSDAMYALLSSELGNRLTSSDLFARKQRLVSGGVYVALGVGAALSGHRTNP